jgi:hypothetical protein
MGQALLKKREQMHGIHDLIAVATACQPSYPWKH